MAKLKQLLGSFLKRIESDDSDNLMDWIEDQRVFLSKLTNDSSYFLDIRNDLNVWVESCSGMETYVQQDVCFDAQNSDSISIKFRKLIKRAGRKISRGRTGTGNTFRKLVGKNPQSAPEWTHTVNWDLVSGRVRNVVLQQLVQMLISDLQLRREIVLALVHVTDILTSLSRTDDKNEAIKLEITSLENRLSEGESTDSVFEVIDVKLDEILSDVT
ncbi:MAG: hypothetical protein LAT57_11090, partial [Balneolales bacterium]|nr:hypothetical protein [Balneolales bacterium]